MQSPSHPAPLGLPHLGQPLLSLAALDRRGEDVGDRLHDVDIVLAEGEEMQWRQRTEERHLRRNACGRAGLGELRLLVQELQLRQRLAKQDRGLACCSRGQRLRSLGERTLGSTG